MSTHDIIVVIGLWIMTIGGAIIMPATWRGTNKETIRIGFSWWPMGKPSLHSGIRTIPVDYAMMSSGTVAVSAYFAASVASEPWREILLAIRSVFFTLMFIALLLAGSIFCVNRPKRLVAPHLRGEKGFFGMWGDEIRERRERKRQ